MQFLYVHIEKTKNQRLSKKILIFFYKKPLKNNIFNFYTYLQHLIMHNYRIFVYFKTHNFRSLQKQYKF